MIQNHDRSGWFGASDTARIMGNWNTQTFYKWWAVKLGLFENNFTTLAMQAGTAYEHRILNFCRIPKMDRQIRKPWIRLRVNLDGEDKLTIHEVKTHSEYPFVVSKAYWMQCQVEMYAAKKKCEILSYRLLEEDYWNYFNPIDESRIGHYPIMRDDVWIREKYLPRLRYLAKCLKKRTIPKEEEFLKWMTFRSRLIPRLWKTGRMGRGCAFDFWRNRM